MYKTPHFFRCVFLHDSVREQRYIQGISYKYKLLYITDTVDHIPVGEGGRVVRFRPADIFRVQGLGRPTFGTEREQSLKRTAQHTRPAAFGQRGVFQRGIRASLRASGTGEEGAPRAHGGEEQGVMRTFPTPFSTCASKARMRRS